MDTISSKCPTATLKKKYPKICNQKDTVQYSDNLMHLTITFITLIPTTILHHCF